MVRILVVTNMYPPHHYGGLELSCADVVGGLRRRGHAVEVLTSTVRVPGVAAAADRDEAVRRKLGVYWYDHELRSPPPWRRLAIEHANQRSLRRALDEARPDVVSVWGMGAMSLGLLDTLVGREIPVVYCVCDDWIEYANRLDAWTRMFQERPRLGTAVRRITGLPTRMPDISTTGTFCWVSERTRTFAEERTGQRFPRSSTVYSGVDVETFAPDPSGPRRPWRWDLAYVGRIDPRKGVDVAVRALAELPDGARLRVVGRGDSAELQRLGRLARQVGVADRVEFGAADRAGLVEIYRDADAVLFTSRWDEPFGLVPLEAMACGTPVVATGRGGSSEFLADGVNCLRYAAEDHVALADAVRRLADDAALRERLVAKGFETAQGLSVESLVDVMEAWHVAAAEGFASGAPAHRSAPVRGSTP